MTINKAQGQTLRRVGVYLEHAAFSHGQLYVAASRVGDPRALQFFVPGGRRLDLAAPQALGLAKGASGGWGQPLVHHDWTSIPPRPG